MQQCDARTPIDLAKELSRKLAEFTAVVAGAPGDEIDPELARVLAPNLCRLTKMLIPNVHQKIDEIIFADERKDLKISDHQHGADLKGPNGECYELKVSVCTSRQGRCNFNWNVPKGATDEERKGKMHKLVTAKTKDGGAILRIKDGKDNTIAEYKFSCAFLLEYFARIKLGNSGNHNMGCERCGKCKGFHRLERMKYINEQVNKAVTEEDRTLIDWALVMYKPACPKDNCKSLFR